MSIRNSLKRPLVWLLACGMVGAIIWLGGAGVGAEVGRPLPALDVVPASPGSAPSFEDYEGRVRVVSFWATWCPSCKRDLKALGDLATDLEPQGVAVLAVSVDRATATPTGVLELAEDLPSALGVYWDAAGSAVTKLGLVGLPTAFVIDRQGVVRRVLVGPMDWAHPRYSDSLLLLAAEGM